MWFMFCMKASNMGLTMQVILLKFTAMFRNHQTSLQDVDFGHVETANNVKR